MEIFIPLGDRILVKRKGEEEKTVGGIIIPDTAKEKPITGHVIAVGKGIYDSTGKIIPMQLNVGDLIVFGKWAGTEVKFEGQEYLIMKESDVMGIIPASKK